MLRMVLGVIAGFIAWLIVWVSNEIVLSAVWPEWFGVQQRAFQEALEQGGEFAAETRFLLTHIISGAVISTLSGYLAALIAGENTRSPLILGLLLTALGVLKAVLSWPHVPLWYHLVFTALLMPMALLGGKLRRI